MRLKPSAVRAAPWVAVEAEQSAVEMIYVYAAWPEKPRPSNL